MRKGLCMFITVGPMKKLRGEGGSTPLNRWFSRYPNALQYTTFGTRKTKQHIQTSTVHVRFHKA
jgi:hypothetical protein